ncbi:hypothetical protein [Acinetobacter tandoii]|uniref:Uncharacterized protein n=1 Tax=Acinetobacter tandoii DSM 14970 = CIP 107469 TaxID=1120927 RepID=R9B7T7_9GAMM|nr:hypothetical protein [Acinetobacter tandoii]EOR10528.1 hypothetical protein I593_00699 [Acinetobacter tandoii DSM 14970 = CIP 107469]
MSLSLMKKPAIRQSLAVTMATLMMTVTHAASAEQEEIAQLRVDVEVLKALIQQNFPQVKQAPLVSNTIKLKTTISTVVEKTPVHSAATTVNTTYQFHPKAQSTLGDGLMLANDMNNFADNLASTDAIQIKTLQQGWRNMMPVTLGMKYV